MAGLALALSAATAAAEPPLWVARDADSTVYLFGTIHLLPEDGGWRAPAVDAAFASADELWLEVDVLGDRTIGFGETARLGTSPDRPLSDRLSPADHARLVAAAGRLKIPPSALEKLRPWLAAVTLGLQAAKASGIDSEGADMVFAREASARALPIRAFETARDQLHFFADLDEAAETALLVQTLDDLEKGDDEFRTMLDTWLSGDVERLEETVLDNLRASGPVVYDVLLTRRNRAWAERIAAMLAGRGTQFVAVGAGHLLGPDSVPALLESRGIAVERVEEIR